MATITRCDECKKLSDEQGIGYIGKHWSIFKYKEVMATIRTSKDICRTCLKKIVEDNSAQEEPNE